MALPQSPKSKANDNDARNAKEKKATGQGGN